VHLGIDGNRCMRSPLTATPPPRMQTMLAAILANCALLALDSNR
jgi:hypothetical protein